MKAFVLAAGLGTRLRPWTLHHPKALVPVGGQPMLQRVITRLRCEGFDDITVNVHHFADQIIDFLTEHEPGVRIHISDESERLLDTGGGILRAGCFLAADEEPFLVHNVDILSDAPLGELMNRHIGSDCDVSLVTSDRKSSRELIFDRSGNLRGWHNKHTDEYKPIGFSPIESEAHARAFSGIYIMNPSVLDTLQAFASRIGSEVFPVMDFFLRNIGSIKIKEMELQTLHLIDIGKPDTLSEAQALFVN